MGSCLELLGFKLPIRLTLYSSHLWFPRSFDAAAWIPEAYLNRGEESPFISDLYLGGGRWAAMKRDLKRSHKYCDYNVYIYLYIYIHINIYIYIDICIYYSQCVSFGVYIYIYACPKSRVPGHAQCDAAISRNCWTKSFNQRLGPCLGRLRVERDGKGRKRMDTHRKMVVLWEFIGNLMGINGITLWFHQAWLAGKWTIEIGDFPNLHSCGMFHCHVWLPCRTLS